LLVSQKVKKINKNNGVFVRFSYLFVAGLVLCLDQLTKYLVSVRLIEGQSLAVIRNIFHLTLVKNSGIAFGFFPNGSNVFIVFSFLAVAVIFIILFKNKDSGMLSDIALSLVLGGAAGNLIDRLRWGYIIDFFDFRVWPVFNVADSAISIGVVLLCFYMFKCEKV